MAKFTAHTTLWIKTCWRPAKCLRTVASARALYPELRIVVADDAAKAGRANVSMLKMAGADVVVPYPEDIGRPACWNDSLHNHIGTDYTILCDDDELWLGTDLTTWGEWMHPDGNTLVAGRVVNRDGSLASRYVGLFERLEGDVAGQAELYCRHLDPTPVEPWDCDYAPNFWVAPTAALRRAPWDVELKACAHADTFLRYQQAGFRVIYDPRVVVTHIVGEPPADPPEYRQLRDGRYPEYRALFERKRGLRAGGFHD